MKFPNVKKVKSCSGIAKAIQWKYHAESCTTPECTMHNSRNLHSASFKLKPQIRTMIAFMMCDGLSRYLLQAFTLFKSAMQPSIGSAEQPAYNDGNSSAAQPPNHSTSAQNTTLFLNTDISSSSAGQPTHSLTG